MLKEYKKKRDFNKTPEPSGSTGKSNGRLTFVIQKHDARRLHYDVRLEIDGVLVSWAVPKGPSLDPSEKRLAVQTEDHPMDYAGFEGVIPRGQYGAGEVIVWDKGVYTPDEDGQLSWDDREEAQTRMRKMLEKGKISVFLEGEKLRGSWAFVRLKKTEKEWLLIKHKDAFASKTLDVTSENESVTSGRTLDDVRTGRGRKTARTNEAAQALEKAKAARFPAKIMPMLASLSDAPFSKEGWVFEPKLDGIRAIAYIKDGDVRLQSRNGLDLTRQYPVLARALRTMKDDVVLDGEIVALDQNGRPSFQLLQGRLNLTQGTDIKKAESNTPIVFYAFDALHFNGKDLRALPLIDRKAVLRKTLVPSQHIRLVEAFDDDGINAYKACMENGLEGVVGKRLDSVYESGKRTRDWLKVKATQSAEFLICGFSEGTGARNKSFGSLIMGEREHSGKLKYVGGVGTGFNEKLINSLMQQMKPLITTKCPFDRRPPGKLNPTWVKPKLVAEIKFAERTRDGMLRAPVFMHLRQDIEPEDVAPPSIVAVKDIQPSKIRRTDSDHTTGEAPNTVLSNVLDQLDNDKEKISLEVEGNELALTNLNKLFWPGFSGHPVTKRGYIQYLAKVSQYILPHLKDRPLTLLRFPNGIAGGKFYQKHWDKGLPPFVQTVRIFTEQVGEDQNFLICRNLSTLLWLGQVADLELHTVHTRIDPTPDAAGRSTDFTGSTEKVDVSILNYPDFLVIDLDPYLYSGKEKKGEEPELHREGFKMACEAAFWVKELLDSLKIQSFVKTSGRTGLHLFVPIVRNLDYPTVRAITEVFGRTILKAHPDKITMDWQVVKRTGKIFFDHNMNARSKTLASIYSPRVAPEATISTPLRWDELHSVYPTEFTMDSVPDRLAEIGDLWRDILDHKSDLELLLGARSESYENATKDMAASVMASKEKSPRRSKRTKK